ncbi:TIR domain-containing protein [Terricaulis sp.]|uniref:TIR domain-containing protein n=1 Tax=Terricaulis sp. TaxID=2768686 RepID=UPI003782D23A
MADVFLSYASEDRDRVRPLAEALQARGFNVWWDRQLGAGEDYTVVIDRELRAARAVIVVWTQGSALSTYVRDEAGRARDQGRLVPVLLDRVDIPLGFGAFQAEDFTRWNGGANAPQMQILEEALRAKLEGRDINGMAIARKRRQLMARVRIVSVLTVIALIVGIGVGVSYLRNPHNGGGEVTQADLKAELLRLLAEGKLTPDQAIQLAEILQAGSLGDQTASLSPEQTPAASRTTDVQLASISEAEFDQQARQTYNTAFVAVAQHADEGVRQAAADMADPTKRQAAMQTLWDYARAHPDDPMVEQIYLLCGSVGEANDLPLGQRALEVATNLSPRDPAVWRMLSRSYQRVNRTSEAEAAANVGEGIEAQNNGDAAAAERQLDSALPALQPEVAASVASRLGDIAVERQDWTAASARFTRAYSLREEANAQQPNVVAEAGLQADAQQMVIALDRSGRVRDACERLRQAQEQHDVAAPDQALVERCQRQFRTPLRTNRVGLAPQLRRPPEERAPQPPPPEERRP